MVSVHDFDVRYPAGAWNSWGLVVTAGWQARLELCIVLGSTSSQEKSVERFLARHDDGVKDEKHG